MVVLYANIKEIVNNDNNDNALLKFTCFFILINKRFANTSSTFKIK